MKRHFVTSRVCATAFVLALFGFASVALANLIYTSVPPTEATVGEPYSYKIVLASDERDGKIKGRLRITARVLPVWLEFDGNDTLFGTPGADDVGEHIVKLRAQAKGEDAVDQEFTITVSPAPTTPPPQDRADLAASITVAPNPAVVDSAVVWTVTARNVSTTDVANVALETTFSGDAEVQIDAVDDPACAVEPRGATSAVVCRWSPLAGGAFRSAQITGRVGTAGDVVATATVSIVDATPADREEGNDSSTTTLTVVRPQSSKAAQTLTAAGAAGLAVADFNADGWDDVAVATDAGEGTLVFLNDTGAGDGRPFAAVPIVADDDSAAAAAIAAGDIDGDGAMDLVVASNGASARLLVNNGAGGFDAVVLDDRTSASRAVAVGDVDGDSLLDIAFARDGDGIVLRNLGSRQFTAQTLDTGPSVAVLAVDFHADASAELVFALADGDAVAYRWTTSNAMQIGAVETGAATSAAAGDLDADGIPDLAVGRDTAALVLLTASVDPLSVVAASSLGEAATNDVLIGDFDLDGRADVVTIGAAGAHRLYSNDGGQEPAFVERAGGFSGDAASAGASGAFDAGGLLDVAVAEANAVAIFLNVGRDSGSLLGAPLLTLNGSSSMTLSIGQTFADPGATAIDDVDGDLTDQIVVDNPVDTTVIGRYSVTYEVTDSGGNLSTATRLVEVRPRSPAGGGGGGAVDPAWLLLVAASAIARNSRRRPA